MYLERTGPIVVLSQQMPYRLETLSLTQHMTAAAEPAVEPKSVQRRILLSFWAIVLMAMVLCAIYITQKTRSFVAPEAQSAGGTITMKPVGWLNAPDPPTPLPDSASPYLARMTEVDQVPIASPLKLDMLATQDAWVEVATDGQLIYAKLVRANETLSFEASKRIRMLTGNVQGLELRFNGKPVAADTKGRVRTIEFTGEGSRDLNSAQPVSKS